MNGALSLVSTTPIKSTVLQPGLAQRLVLYGGELYRVPAAYRMLQIKAGLAYVTHAGRDRILSGGQGMNLDHAADVALVSTLGGEPVVLELFNA